MYIKVYMHMLIKSHNKVSGMNNSLRNRAYTTAAHSTSALQNSERISLKASIYNQMKKNIVKLPK